MDLSIVIPLYNEVDNVNRLYAAIRDAMQATDFQYEMIFVDDGSNDGTLSALKALVNQDACVCVLHLRNNFGQTAALSAGIHKAVGDVVITMDGDLQNDPRDIPLLVKKIEEGYDMVTGWRKNRQDPYLSRVLPSRIANWCMAKVLGVPIHDTGCALKAYRRELIRRIPLYAEFHRYTPAMCTMASDRFAEVVVRHCPRLHGKSKYGLSRIGRVLLDVIAIKMLLACAQRPLQWYGGLSILVFLPAAALGMYSLVALVRPDWTNTYVFPSVSLLLAFLGLQLLFSGIFAELVVHAEPEHPVVPLRDVVELPSALR